MTAACISVSAAGAQSANSDSTNPLALLAQVQATNGFSGDSLKPWHLKANYELYDAANKIVARGVFEEWWLSQHHWRRSYTGSHYTGSEYRLPSGYAYEGDPVIAYDADQGTAEEGVRDARAPWPEALIAEKILYPVNYWPLKPQAKGSESWPMHFVRPVAAPQSLSCLSPLSEDSLLEEYYCYTDGKPELRQSLVHFVTTIYSQTSMFQDRIIGRELEISINDHDLLKVHVTTLDELPSTDDDVFPAGLATSPPPATCFGSTTFLTEQNSPPIAKQNHMQDVVVFVGVIDADGHLDSLKAVETPGPSLSDVALAAMRTWGPFKPTLLNGEPVPCVFSTMFNFKPAQ
jgi:Gram-negative bacterial TonB protein C-terminal